MFPLQTATVPVTAAQWQAALTAAFAGYLVGPARATVTGDSPAIAAIDVDQSHCRLADDARPPDLTAVTPVEPGPTVGRLTVVADPLHVHGVPASVRLDAAHARFDLARNAAGHYVALLADTTSGTLTARLGSEPLASALLQAARAAAAPHGVGVRSVRPTLVARGPRDVDVTLDIAAKKFVTLNLRVTGRLTVDDMLTFRATRLAVDGTGMAASLGASLLKPQLAKLEAQSWTLTDLALGEVRVTDVSVDVSNGLAITAHFGSGGAA